MFCSRLVGLGHLGLALLLGCSAEPSPDSPPTRSQGPPIGSGSAEPSADVTGVEPFQGSPRVRSLPQPGGSGPAETSGATADVMSQQLLETLLGSAAETADGTSPWIASKNPEATAHTVRGALANLSDQPQEAVGHFSEAIRIDPGYAEAVKGRGGAYLLLGRLRIGSSGLHPSLATAT